MLTAILTYIGGFLIVSIISYLIAYKEGDITVGDLINIGLISLSSWAGVFVFILGGISHIIYTLPFSWIKKVVITKSNQ